MSLAPLDEYLKGRSFEDLDPRLIRELLLSAVQMKREREKEELDEEWEIVHRKYLGKERTRGRCGKQIKGVERNDDYCDASSSWNVMMISMHSHGWILHGICDNCRNETTETIYRKQIRDEEYKRLKVMEVFHNTKMAKIEERLAQIECAPPGQGGPEYVKALREEIASGLFSQETSQTDSNQ